MPAGSQRYTTMPCVIPSEAEGSSQVTKISSEPNKDPSASLGMTDNPDHTPPVSAHHKEKRRHRIHSVTPPLKTPLCLGCHQPRRGREVRKNRADTGAIQPVFEDFREDIAVIDGHFQVSILEQLTGF